MALATLSIDLVAKIAELQAGMDKAGRLSEKTAADIERKFSGLKTVFVGLGGVVAGVFSGGAALQGVRVLIDGLDALNDAADATGASIANLSALEDIAARAGTPFETATAAVVKLNQALAAAKPGSGQAEALKAIGLSAEELRRQDPAQALLQVSIALAGFENNGAKARLASELLGRSYAELAPLLNDLAESGQLNATVTAEQAKQAEILNKEMANLQKSVVDVGRALVGPAIGGLNQFIAKAAEASDTSKTFRERLSLLFDTARSAGFGALILGSADDVRLKSAREELAAIEVALTRIDIGEERRAELERKRIGRLQTIDKLINESGRRPANEGGGGLRSNALSDRPDKPAGGAGRTAAVALSNEAQKYLQTLQQQLDKTAELTVFEQTLARIRKGDLVFSAELTSKRLLDIAAEIDATKDATRISSERSAARIADYDAATDAAKRNEAAQRDLLRSLLQATPTGQFEQITREIEFLNQQFDAGNIASIEQWAEAIRNATGKLAKDTEVKIEGLSEFSVQASRNIQDALGRTITATLKGEFDSIEKLWGNMLLSLASQAIAADLGKFFGAGGNGATYIASILGLFGFAKGGAFGAGGAPITAFANGGVLTGATPFTFGGGRLGVAGEAGPEAIMPLRRGANGRLGVEMAGGGGGGNTVIHVAAGVNRAEVVAAIQLAMQSVKGDIYGFLQARRVI